MKIEPLICKNCAGIINRKSMICEYCGTHYKLEHEELMPLMIEHYSSPVRVFNVKHAVSHELMHSGISPDVIADHVMMNMRDQLAKAISDCMEMETHFEPKTMQQIFTARIRILEPDFRFSNYERGGF